MDVRQRIIEEATGMFMEQGFKAIRMDDIASRLSISKRTIYEIFGDKEKLITESLDYYYTAKNGELEAHMDRGNNIIERFVLAIEFWERYAEVNYRLMSNLNKLYPAIYNNFLVKKNIEGTERLKNGLMQGIKDGIFLEHLNLDLSIAIFTYSMYGISSKKASELPQNISQRNAFKYIVVYFLRGIATEKGIRIIDEKITTKLNETEVKI